MAGQSWRSYRHPGVTTFNPKNSAEKIPIPSSQLSKILIPQDHEVAVETVISIVNGIGDPLKIYARIK